MWPKNPSPHPSKKAILDFTGRRKIGLCASGENENWRENLSFRKKKDPPAPSQRKLPLDFSCRNFVQLDASATILYMMKLTYVTIGQFLYKRIFVFRNNIYVSNEPRIV